MNIFKKGLIITSIFTLPIFSFVSNSASAAPYSLAEENLSSSITLSGDKVENNLIVFDESYDNYNINVASSLDISGLWKYNDYYYSFDPTKDKEGSLTTELKGNFEINLKLDSKFVLDSSKDLKDIISENISTDADSGVKGKNSVFFDYFMVTSVSKNGNVINISLSYKDGITGQYLLERKSNRPNTIFVNLNGYLSLSKSSVNVGEKLHLSSDYTGVIVMDTNDKYQNSLKNKINETRKGVKSLVADLYFPTDATSPVTELHLPVKSSTSDEIEFVSKNSAKRAIAAVRSVLPNTGAATYSYIFVGSLLFVLTGLLVFRKKNR